MVHLRAYTANGVDVRQLYIETREMECKVEIQVPSQTIAALQQAVGSSYETLGNIPTLQQKRGPWRDHLCKIAMSTTFFR